MVAAGGSGQATSTLAEIERRLWLAADQLRANSTLTPSQYRDPILGLIFLAYAEYRFKELRPQLEAKASARRPVTPDDYRAKGVLFIPDVALLDYLVRLPERTDIGMAVDTAMSVIETANIGLNEVLPRNFAKLDPDVLREMLRLFAPLPARLSGDAFGLIYEYFLSNFALAEGRLGGEFYTPQSIVRLIVEVIEPFHGRVFDPACGSGGMFVQSAKFVARHRGSPNSDLSVFGQEQKEVTVPIGKMNLALHGLSGDIRLANSYYEDLHHSVGAFDFVMANPPFNVNGIDKTKLDGQTARYPFGLPKADNGNYMWIQLFYSSLAARGRAGFVMANSAADARGSEADIRRGLIRSKAVDVMIAISSNFFYSVSLPVTLWFLDKSKRGTDREDKTLFIDARQIFRQLDRAHRDFLPEQIEYIANIVRLYRGADPEYVEGSEKLIKEMFPAGRYSDVPGLCKVATIAEIEAEDWSLVPARYVGSEIVSIDDIDFMDQLTTLFDEFTRLSDEAELLRKRIDAGIRGLLEQ